MNIRYVKTAVSVFAMSAMLALSAFESTAYQALQAVNDDIVAALGKVKAFDGRTVAVLPVAGDVNNGFGNMLRISFTKAGMKCVTGKDDPVLDEIVKEITWDARKSDMLDEKTISRFGKLKSAQIIVTGRVYVSKDDRCVFAETELHATDIETKRHLWGDRFVTRYYLPGVKTVQGLSEIPVEVRKVIQEKLTAEIVRSIGGQKKLKGFDTVAFLPLAGDLDGYVANIIRDAVVKTALTPRNLDIRTLAEARLALNDKKFVADGLLYGALRDISLESEEKGRKTVSKINVEIQACIEKAGTNEQVWSDTILVSEEIEKELEGLEAVLADYPFLPEALLVLLGVLVVLVIVRKFLSAATRVR